MHLDTPCIGICSTVYGDSICRGCKRYDHEIIDWNRYTSKEKGVIYQRLETQFSTIMSEYIEVADPAMLAAKVLHLQLRLRSGASVAEQAFHLLRLYAHKIQHIEKYGLMIKPAYRHLPLPALLSEIDTQLFAHAHQQK